MRIGITGISGSFGTALCDALAEVSTNTIIGIARDELKAEQIMARHRAKHDNVRVMVVAAGLSDEPALNRVFKDCEVLYHAAALKRISGSVYATEEIVKTNIIGTMHILEVARKQGIGKTLLISSDKAVEATNLYGSSKFTAECLAIQSNAFIYPATGGCVAAVRWGNVLGSRGSVVNLWRRQCKQEGAATLTDPRMTRFIITMPQAVSFAWTSVEMMEGGEIFVPLLRSALMVDLLKAVLLEQGCDPHAFRVTGLRPGGEKLHEVLLSQEEPQRTFFTSERGHYCIQPSHRTWSAQPYMHCSTKSLAGCLYSSESTTKYTDEELRALIKTIPYQEE